MMFHIAPAEVIFSGFASTALWLIFSGLVIGVAIVTTGLGEKIAMKIADQLNDHYLRLIGGLTLVGVAFSFLMPSATGRIMLLVPIAMAIADHCGFSENTNGRTGVILSMSFGSFIPAFSILPANVPNMVLAGMAEQQYEVSLLFGDYFLLHFPVLGVLKALLMILLIVRLFPDRPVRQMAFTNLQKTGRFSREERDLAIILAVLLLLWFTDGIHHISPAWIALMGALCLMFPFIEIVSTKHFNTCIKFAPLFFVAGVLGLGSMIAHSGLGTVIGHKLLAVLPLHPDTPFVNYMSIIFASALTGTVTTLPGVPAVMTPLSGDIAHLSGMPVISVLMLQVPGFSTVIFPYQAPPIVVAMHLAGENLGRGIRFMALLAFLSCGILLPLNFLWWKMLGWI
jgi:anion transporter